MSVSRRSYFEKVARRRQLERRILKPRVPRVDMPLIEGRQPRSPLIGFSQRLLLLSSRTAVRSIREAARRQLKIWCLYQKIAGDRACRAYKVEPYSYRIRRAKYGGRYKTGVPRIFLYGYDAYGEGTIKSFLRQNILDVLITRTKFTPRWTVEIGR